MPDTAADRALSACKNAAELSPLLTDSLLCEWLAQMNALGAGIAIMRPDLRLLHTVGADFPPAVWRAEALAASAAAQITPAHPVAWLSPAEHPPHDLQDQASYAWLHTPSTGRAPIFC